MKLKKYLAILVLFFLVFSRLSSVTYSITEEQLTELENNLTELEKSNENKQKELNELKTELNELQQVNEQTENELKEVKKSLQKSENKNKAEKLVNSFIGFILGVFSTLAFFCLTIF